jgi:hypothetical protein
MIIRPARLAALALLCACAGAPAANRATAAEPPDAARDTVIRRADIPPLSVGGTLLDSATVDVDGDGAPERVDLGVNVTRNERGQWEADVHNVWTVVVRDGTDSYPLVRTYDGAAAFWVIPGDSAHPAEILVQTSSLTVYVGGTRLEKFVYDRQREGYVRTGMVESFGRLARYRGPPADAEQGELFPPTSWRGEEPQP